MRKILMASTFLICQLGGALAQAPAEAEKTPEVGRQQQQQQDTARQPAESSQHAGKDRDGRDQSRGWDFDRGPRSRGDDRERPNFRDRDDDRGSGRHYGYREDRDSYRRRDDRFDGGRDRGDRYRDERYGDDRNQFDRRDRSRGAQDESGNRRTRIFICMEDDDGSMFCRRSNAMSQRHRL